MSFRLFFHPWWLAISLLAGIPLRGAAQVERWVKLIQTSTEAGFLAAIQPARFGLGAPQLGLLTAWEQDAHLGGDSLYSLLRAWNTYPKPRQTGVTCRYEVQLDATHLAPF
jgi:hypothetical protein